MTKVAGLIVLAVLIAACSEPVPLTATISAVASTNTTVGGTAQLAVNLTNTGPRIPHLGLVFRTHDAWYATHRMTDLAGCTVASDSTAFDCGDLNAGETRSLSFAGVVTAAGTFHYELALRELVQPFHYVNDHSDGPDVQVWDEQATAI